MATTLTKEQIETIRDLHRLRPLYSLKIVALYALAVAVGWGIVHAPHWALRIPGYFAMAAIFAGLGVLLHDGAHGLLFENRALNRLASQIIATSLGIAFTQFRYAHLFHHRDTLTDQDRDRLFYLRSIPYTIVNGGRALYLSTVAGLKSAPRRQVIIYFLELATVIGLFGGVAAFLIQRGWWLQAIHVYVIPYLLFPSLLITRLLLEHYDCDFYDEYRMTRTIKTNAVCRFLWSNVNYHTVHHFWQTIPWYNLKRAHDCIEAHLVENQAVMSEGYVATLADAWRKYGFSRPPYWDFPKREESEWSKRRPSLALRA